MSKIPNRISPQIKKNQTVLTPHRKQKKKIIIDEIIYYVLLVVVVVFFICGIMIESEIFVKHNPVFNA